MGVNKRLRSKSGKKRIRRQKSGQNSFSFHDMDAEVLLDAVEQVTKRGGLVMLMATRDRFLRGVKLKHDDIEDDGTVWVSTEEQFTSYVADFVETLDADAD